MKLLVDAAHIPARPGGVLQRVHGLAGVNVTHRAPLLRGLGFSPVRWCLTVRSEGVHDAARGRSDMPVVEPAAVACAGGEHILAGGAA